MVYRFWFIEAHVGECVGVKKGNEGRSEREEVRDGGWVKKDKKRVFFWESVHGSFISHPRIFFSNQCLENG